MLLSGRTATIEIRFLSATDNLDCREGLKESMEEGMKEGIVVPVFANLPTISYL